MINVYYALETKRSNWRFNSIQTETYIRGHKEDNGLKGMRIKKVLKKFELESNAQKKLIRPSNGMFALDVCEIMWTMKNYWINSGIKGSEMFIFKYLLSLSNIA